MGQRDHRRRHPLHHRGADDLRSRGCPSPPAGGAGVIKAILSEQLAGSTFTWSELEERFLALVMRAKLPQPQINQWIVLPDGEPAIRADFS